MSPKAPRLTGRELIQVLLRHEFVVSRIRGSHHILRHPDGRATTVPVHRGEVIGPGLFSKRLRDTDLPPEAFL